MTLIWCSLKFWLETILVILSGVIHWSEELEEGKEFLGLDWPSEMNEDRLLSPAPILFRGRTLVEDGPKLLRGYTLSGYANISSFFSITLVLFNAWTGAPNAANDFLIELGGPELSFFLKGTVVIVFEIGWEFLGTIFSFLDLSSSFLTICTVPLR